MKKNWVKSKTFWGALLLFVGGGLEALGYTGVSQAVIDFFKALGLPMMGFGIRDGLQ